MMNYEARTSPMGRSFSNPLHLREVSLNSTGDESIFPTSTLSPRSDCNSSSDLTSISWTARSGNSTNFLEDSVFGRSLVDENSMRLSFGHTDGRESTILGNWRKDQSIIKPSWTNVKSSKEQVSRRTPPISKMFQMEQSNAGFMPITATNFFSQRSRTPSPGISKMLLSLGDHAVKHPCTANASTLYQNTRTHCNPSELGQQTHDECMVSNVIKVTLCYHSGSLLDWQRMYKKQMKCLTYKIQICVDASAAGPGFFKPPSHLRYWLSMQGEGPWQGGSS